MFTQRLGKALTMALSVCMLLGLASLAQETSGSAFVHVAAASNTVGGFTDIDNAACNGQPNARVLITRNLSPSGAVGVVNDHPVGVRYRDGKWSICNQDGANMPLGAAFNVHVLDETSSNAGRHVATAQDISWGNSTAIEYPTTDNNPDAIVFVTPYSESSERLDDVHHVGVWYWDTRTLVYYEDRADMPVGATFNTELYPGAGSSVFVHTATSANTPAVPTGALGCTWIDHPLANGNRDAILLVTHNYNPGGIGGTYLDGAIAVLYDEQQARWAICNQSGAMPADAAFNVLVLGAGGSASASPAVDFSVLREGGVVQTVIAANGLPQATTRVRWTGDAEIGVPVALDADGLQVAVHERGMTPELHEIDLVWHPWHGNGQYTLLLQLADFNTATVVASKTVTVLVEDIPAGTPTVNERLIELYQRRFGIQMSSPVFGRYNKPIPQAANESIWVSAAYIGDRFYTVGLRDAGEELADSFGINTSEPSICRPLGNYRMLVVAGSISATNVQPTDVTAALETALVTANQRWATASAAQGHEPLLSLELTTIFVRESLSPDRLLSANVIRSLTQEDPAQYDVIVQLSFDTQAASVGYTVFNCCVPGGSSQASIQFNVAERDALRDMAVAVLEHEFIHDLGWMHWWPEGDGSTRARLGTAGARLPGMMFGWVDSDGDGVIEILDPTPYGMAP